jgi:hypothetical protein
MMIEKRFSSVGASSPVLEGWFGGRRLENPLVAVGELVVVIVDWLHLDPVVQPQDLEARCRVDGSVDHPVNRGHPVDSIDLEVALPMAVLSVVDVVMVVHRWVLDSARRFRTFALLSFWINN